MVTKVVTGKDGRMHTVDVVPPPSREAIDKLRREVKDIAAGNVPFHTDEFAAPKVQPDYVDSDFHLIHQGFYGA